MDTASRRAKGLSIDFNFLDVSLVAVRQKATVIETNMLETFANPYKPFAESLWLCILGAVSMSAFAMWGLERRSWQADTHVMDGYEGDFQESEGDPDHHQMAYDAYKSHCFAWYQYSGVSYGFSPVTAEGMMLAASWSLLTLLLVCGYTANLAQVLITKANVVTAVSSIDDARARPHPEELELAYG